MPGAQLPGPLARIVLHPFISSEQVVPNRGAHAVIVPPHIVAMMDVMLRLAHPKYHLRSLVRGLMAVSANEANEEIAHPNANQERDLPQEISGNADYKWQRNRGNYILEKLAPDALPDSFFVVERMSFSLKQPAMHEDVHKILGKRTDDARGKETNCAAEQLIPGHGSSPAAVRPLISLILCY